MSATDTSDTDTSDGPGAWTGEVLAATALGAHFTRVTLSVPSYRTLGVPDESVTLYFPRPGESAPPAMTFTNGAWGYHGLPDAPIGRNYTIRAADGETLTVDFVRHGHGVASTWAERAKPGDGIVLWRQRAWYRPPADTDWIVLAADETGLPAIARTLRQHTGPAPITVLADGSYPDVPLPASTGSLFDRMRAFTPPPGRGYVWFAGECGDARKARTLWRDVHGLSRDRVTSVGYWRADAQTWERRYEEIRPEIELFYQHRLDAGDSLTEAGDHVEDELARRGL
ncbi:siderophore-interacting protein [Actinoplanes sp. NPDC051851]|uniref:siderophore-interacting protein n=1 Tax=Actinoplanes sp. NPDC051851 TaxID=3154753 RepID=UPI00341C85C2